MNDKQGNRFSSGEDKEDDVFVIPREIDGKPVRELTYELLNKLDGIEKATKIVIPDSITSIEYRAFRCCPSLTSAVIPDSVTSISGGVFSFCNNLKTIETSSSNPNFQTIDGVLFTKDGKTLLADPGGKEDEYVVPDTVTSIGCGAFSWCESLTTAVIPDSVTSVREWTFRDCDSLTNVEIPNSVKSIGDCAFEDCLSLTRVVIPKSVTSIRDRVFLFCTSLTRVVIPNSVTTIGEEAFKGCGSLTRVVIPESVTSIEKEAFETCESLTTAVISKSVKSIGKNAFSSCGKLKTIETSSLNANFQTIDGVLFTKDGKTLIAVPGGKEGKYVVPDTVTSIGEEAFIRCRSLTSVVIPASVKLGEAAFSESCRVIRK